jgi:hypothetical protein
VVPGSVRGADTGERERERPGGGGGQELLWGKMVTRHLGGSPIW